YRRRDVERQTAVQTAVSMCDHRLSRVLRSSFFFYGYGDHRDLHSFPTRRSSDLGKDRSRGAEQAPRSDRGRGVSRPPEVPPPTPDRKSTRLNSSHVKISYAVFCLKKKKNRPSAARSMQRTAAYIHVAHAIWPATH